MAAAQAPADDASHRPVGSRTVRCRSGTAMNSHAGCWAVGGYSTGGAELNQALCFRALWPCPSAAAGAHDAATSRTLRRASGSGRAAFAGHALPRR
jgi:hypothetical protein